MPGRGDGGPHRGTQKALTRQLRRSEADGLVTRRSYPEAPARAEYRLSEAGRSPHELLDRFCAWGDRYARDRGYAIVKPGAEGGEPWLPTSTTDW
ncbi:MULTISPECIES: helix-turn-helix domain-containing protein [unclassified Nocardiopsis]|uniref:winged helix-turn-helix transcriptional regulator n=1 Tax=unclassified Nocardiopsis TaxID=2649073 RepID=UPI00135A37E5|nr:MULTISPECIES: helix-turn-helix domain-containing protein [unclassified Nocardiopsis]